MTEHPILFSTEMVKAILDGRKSQTRRVVKPQPKPFKGGIHPNHEAIHPAPYIDSYCSERKTEKNPRGMSKFWCWWTEDNRQGPDAGKCPYGQPGDLLWVRESWRPWAWWEGERWVFQYKDSCRMEARAADMKDEERQELWEQHQWIKISDELSAAGHTPDDDGVYHFRGDAPLKWRPSIHMPRWASRITLEVTGARVERVRDISLEDMRAEGIRPTQEASLMWRETLTDDFRILWDTINAKRGYSWDSNPWVWVVEFKQVKP